MGAQGKSRLLFRQRFPGPKAPARMLDMRKNIAQDAEVER